MRTPADIARDVDRGFRLFALCTEQEAELKAIEKRLRQDALDRPDEHQPLTDAGREGRRFLAQGHDYTLPITITADKLVMTFAAESAVHERIRKAGGAAMSSLYAPTVTYKAVTDDGKKFRAIAEAVMGEAAPAFVAACRAVDKDGIPKADVKCEWQQAAAAAGGQP